MKATVRIHQMKACLIIIGLMLSYGFAGPLQVELRQRQSLGHGGEGFELRHEQWQGNQTAVIVCDMWDSHHCHNAVMRAKQLAPRIDEFLQKIRKEGGLVIHAPSSCMEFYRGHPARVKVQNVAKAKNLPAGINSWMHWIDEEERQAGYPIDHSDGGEDDDPVVHANWQKRLREMGRNPGSPWVRQIETIGIDGERDFISDSGEECWNILEENSIKHVMLVGVHTNMCVLGRPFGLRQLAKNGKNVVLVRDLTDAMYNPAKHPKVSHFAGTDLVVEHIEKHVCPTITSNQILGGSSFVFNKDARPKLLFMIGEREYQTRDTLATFATEHLTKEYRFEFIVAEDGENDFGGLEAALLDADALFLSVRRRSPPDNQMVAIERFIKSGKPVVGIRTSSHAFSLRGKAPPTGHRVWESFDGEVFGGNYNNHHGKKLATFAKPLDVDHPVLKGVDQGEFSTGGSLYKVLPLAKGATVLLEGRAEGVEEKQPVAWSYKTKWGGRNFYTSLGHVEDFKRDRFQKMLVNAIRWVLEVNKEKRSVNLEEVPGIKVPTDLRIDKVLSEPLISQPLHISFDRKGRLWVVQYLQYPDPAGLIELSRDKVWRVGYDRMPPPPPHAPGSQFRGRDRISIHEDVDGDGVFERHKLFVDGLNLATSIAHGDGGIWVTNPPYLLFYKDVNGDDIPDGAPEVHLSGFGIEDTHSIANSLVLAPDGWLYGAQGSTVSASIIRPGKDSAEEAVKSMGQNIWRYHPQRRTYEIYAEGGGNAFGVEVDSCGRVYSGHNGGDTRGFHYMHGAYYRKSWGKHGALTNAHAYGYFPAMKNIPVERFTHQFILYEEEGLPKRYQGKLWGVDVLHNNVVLSDIFPNGSTFQTRDIERVVQSDNSWFRPVMIAPGPDGALFIADWHDRQVNHYKNHEGDIDHDKGRVYRVQARKKSPSGPVNFSILAISELISETASNARWTRRTALNELRKRIRQNPSIIGLVSKEVAARVAAGWKLRNAVDVEMALMSGLDVLECDFSSSGVRGYAIRRIVDTGGGTAAASRLVSLARTVDSAEELSCLAVVARRIDKEAGLMIAGEISRRNQFKDDPHLPLLVWWIIEQHAMSSPERVLQLFADPVFWHHAIVDGFLVERLMRRFAAEGTQQGFLYCARLLQMAPGLKAKQALMKGFSSAVQGLQLGVFPEPLEVEMKKNPELLSIALMVRMRIQGAVESALRQLENSNLKEPERIELISTLGEVLPPQAKIILVNLIRAESSTDQVKAAAIGALRGYPADKSIVGTLMQSIKSGSTALREAATDYLSGNKYSAREFLAVVLAGDIPKSVVTPVMVEKMKLYGDKEINRLIHALSMRGGRDIDADKINQLQKLITESPGNPKSGEKVFAQRCGSCHLMFGKGGVIGPDLTSYQRGDEHSLLLSIVAPSAEIREGFEHLVIMTFKGDVHSGFRTEENEHAVFLRELSGAARSIPKSEIKTKNYSTVSLMPEGLLDDLKERELQDLFAYLRSTTPPF